MAASTGTAGGMYPRTVPPWPSGPRRMALWEWVFESDDDDLWLEQIGERRGEWVRRNEALRSEVDALVAQLAGYSASKLGAKAVAPSAREARRRILGDIDERLVELVRRDPRYLSTEFVVDRILDARMVITSHDAALPTEILQNVPPTDPSTAELPGAVPTKEELLTTTMKEREVAVTREKLFLKRLAGAVSTSIGKGRGSLISRVHVRRVFEENLARAEAFGVEVRAARRGLPRRKQDASARDPRQVLDEKLLALAPLGADAANRVLANPRAVWEAALIQTEADFDLVERTGPSMDALRKLVRGVAQRAK